MTRLSVAVGFDFDHTLGIDQGLEKEAYVRLAAEFGVTLQPQVEAHHNLIDGLLARFRADRISLDAAAEVFVGEIAEIRAVHRDRPPGERYREICYRLVDELVRPLDGAAEVIATLAQAGVPTAILTNGWSPLQQLKVARALGDFPGAILVSDQIGALKPGEDAFAHLAAALGCARGDIWYVGDNPAVDVAGAHAAGMRAAWFNWEGHTYPDEIAPPDLHLERLPELLDVILSAAQRGSKDR